MSSNLFYKIPFEGQIQKIQELVKNRDWDLEMKVPKEGILIVKIPEEIKEELLFSQQSIIDEETNTKLGTFEIITESDYENETDTKLNYIKEEINSRGNNQNKKNKNKEYKRQISEILLEGETLLKDNTKKFGFYLVNKFVVPKINLNEFHKKLGKEYKDPYDYFLSKNYLIMCFILAIICLVLFKL